VSVKFFFDGSPFRRNKYAKKIYLGYLKSGKTSIMVGLSANFLLETAIIKEEL